KVVNILDITTQEGNNALYNAVRYGHKLLVREIIKERPSLTFKINHKGETPVHVATRFGRRDIIEFLIKEMKDYKGIHIGKMRDKFGNTPSHGIARNANFKVMAALAANDTESLRRINNMGESPLSIAISMRLTNFAARIIDFNPETLDDIGHNGQTPLHVAIKRNDFEVMSVNQNWSKSKMKEEDSPSLCIMLLFNKDSIVAYIKDNNKKIPLYLAAEKGSIGMVDESQHNLLDLAAMNGNVDAVKYSLNLVEIEDLMNSPDVDGNTAFHLAATIYHSYVVTVLSEKTNVKVRAHLTLKALNGAYKFMNPEDVLENPRLDDMKVEIPAKFGCSYCVLVIVTSRRRVLHGYPSIRQLPKGHSVCVGGYVVVAENANALLTFRLCDSASL
ncbi:hypothetical protein Goshw_004937, partial [Gossypium schwendimanii]|nr:hypothetical protein [Gossypium schwendimanii]